VAFLRQREELGYRFAGLRGRSARERCEENNERVIVVIGEAEREREREEINERKEIYFEGVETSSVFEKKTRCFGGNLKDRHRSTGKKKEVLT